MSKIKSTKRIIGLIFTFALVGLVLYGWTQRQEISDQLSLRNYQPSEVISQLSLHTTMTDEGKKIFYVNHPVVTTGSEFNSACAQEASIVLGCYIQNGGIYIYDVTEPRLSGVEEVTAAHEMLHAAYDRLSDQEKQRIDSLTQSTFANNTSDRIKQTVEAYRKQDPSVVPNELHSILATEVSSLPPELETYYKQYFKDRQAIVKYSDSYEAEFDNRRAQVSKYDAQLVAVKKEIEQTQADLAKQYAELETRKQQLDQQLDSGDVAGYNQGVPGFNAGINSYNTAVKAVEKRINDYNALVKQRNALAVEVQDLAKAIDSRSKSF